MRWRLGTIPVLSLTLDPKPKRNRNQPANSCVCACFCFLDLMFKEAMQYQAIYHAI